jgi:hypothetical protein
MRVVFQKKYNFYGSKVLRREKASGAIGDYTGRMYVAKEVIESGGCKREGMWKVAKVAKTMRREWHSDEARVAKTTKRKWRKQ